MRKWQPIFVEKSRIPGFLSFFAPISIGAITLGFIVFSRDEMSETTRRHETIHFQQFLETGFLGFIIVYLWDFIYGYAKYRNGSVAYAHIRAELEAYENDKDKNYLGERKRYAWLLSGTKKTNV